MLRLNWGLRHGRRYGIMKNIVEPAAQGRSVTYQYNINALKCQFCVNPISGEMENQMKRKFVQIAALCLSVVLLALSGGGQRGSAASAGDAGRIIRVGLHYGTGAMEGLNFANSTGVGYRFGYYDESNQFIPLGSTGQKAISVVKTMNVYYGTYRSYTSYHSALTSSSVAVGDYHLELPGSYATFAEAQTVASAYEGGFPAYIGGTFYARIGNYTTRSKVESAQAALAAQGVETAIKGTSEYGISVVTTGTNTILFQFDDLGKGTGMGMEPNAEGPGEYVTLSKNCTYVGGFRFERVNGGSLTVVNILGFEDYIKGVVPHEMSNSWPIEALKAQAVAARSYALSLGTRHSNYHFDICCETHCQAYSGRTKAGSNSDAAVEQTAGQVAVWNGKIAQTSYYSSNGGASESSSTVWGGNQANYPYLVGKVDPYEAFANVKNDWTKTVTSDTLVAKLKAKGCDVGNSVASIAVTSLTDSGNPKMVTFTGSNGKSYSLNTREVVSMLALQSYRYGFDTVAGEQPSGGTTLSVNGKPVDSLAGLYAVDGSGNVIPVDGNAYVITGGGETKPIDQWGGGSGSGGLGTLTSTTGQNGAFTFTGKGWGHNVGMSQWGAYAMAKQGYTYLDILQFYYTGTTVGYM